MHATDELRYQLPRAIGHLANTYGGHPIGSDALRSVSRRHGEADVASARSLEYAMNDTASPDTTARIETKQSAEQAKRTDQDDSSRDGDPLEADFWGQVGWRSDIPSTRGQQDFVFTANTVDEHAKEFLGHGRCHLLSAAIHNITARAGRGWDIVSFDGPYTVDGPHKGEWAPLHSAVRTPDGDLLDIFGRTDLETAKARAGAVSHRVVPVEHMPGDILNDIDHLRGDPYWWAENPPIVVAVVSHFAKQVLRDNGYAHLLD
ncbi:hypothetical protein IU427_25630 [Nocardia beijingensis]|uniref:hypothetical protein n=1 Tax=Nocardia beijingensis TaxID=95162 RepID=UPI00189378CA|nr:hypothetical protein [Nocardia beijingensis]MBF6468517.1 hypothetical protein [Nocardia beijingensis]